MEKNTTGLVETMEDEPEIYKEDVERADVILKVLKDKGTIRDIRDIFTSHYDTKIKNGMIYLFEVRT